jgi:glycerophosphoryl diester phosphodiesterase
MRQGADGIELDVQRCASGELVVCHDETLDRTGKRPWSIPETPWWKLKTATVGGSEHLPLLEDVLHLIPQDKLINVELKCERLDDRGLTRAVVDALLRAGDLDRIIVSSFNALCLWRLAALAPWIKRGYLVDPDRSYFVNGVVLAPLVSRFSIHPAFEDCLPRRVRRWHSAGLAVAAWTVNSANVAAQLAGQGVEYCITDRPGALRRELSAMARNPTPP